LRWRAVNPSCSPSQVRRELAHEDGRARVFGQKRDNRQESPIVDVAFVVGDRSPLACQRGHLDGGALVEGVDDIRQIGPRVEAQQNPVLVVVLYGGGAWTLYGVVFGQRLADFNLFLVAGLGIGQPNLLEESVVREVQKVILSPIGSRGVDFNVDEAAIEGPFERGTENGLLHDIGRAQGRLRVRHVYRLVEEIGHRKKRARHDVSRYAHLASVNGCS
jgi:hypothetical protein